MLLQWRRLATRAGRATPRKRAVLAKGHRAAAIGSGVHLEWLFPDVLEFDGLVLFGLRHAYSNGGRPRIRGTTSSRVIGSRVRRLSKQLHDRLPRGNRPRKPISPEACFRRHVEGVVD